ncbi:hypothetical protein GCM10009700_27600 [Brevibacterium sanguinis]
MGEYITARKAHIDWCVVALWADVMDADWTITGHTTSGWDSRYRL